MRDEFDRAVMYFPAQNLTMVLLTASPSSDDVVVSDVHRVCYTYEDML